ncbi:hypothetical protein CONCODRAFT_11298 [Conidiobolus coronatus NRRL 28638]|uniref:Uncharacterized protein n=1 Tax=Conidiobolus coronatus (strain ATCC 28846 / CBS 209.66 / NRRL 28638) TaxID=796925 RepID=A0A137NVI7_CONC2|nr:hypothetical protein CONCODRAFT_11298 [Conidiobolus coronatus NRRL 28638]|eukprot:KXN66782.1 hypothetical protein CONCODRAFT_11298 [Conidiobolus coronatus NRRL 28638]
MMKNKASVTPLVPSMSKSEYIKTQINQTFTPSSSPSINSSKTKEFDDNSIIKYVIMPLCCASSFWLLTCGFCRFGMFHCICNMYHNSEK